jgi:hypothetical protein
MAFILKDGQKVPVALEATDKDGNAAAVETVSWETSDAALVTITPDATDPKAAVVSTVPGPGTGTATITARADADLGEGVVPIEGRLDIEVVAGDAAVVNITAGAPSDRDA